MPETERAKLARLWYLEQQSRQYQISKTTAFWVSVFGLVGGIGQLLSEGLREAPGWYYFMTAGMAAVVVHNIFFSTELKAEISSLTNDLEKSGHNSEVREIIHARE